MSNLAYKCEIPTEMLDGKIIAMSPRPATNHNIVVANLTGIFHNYLKRKPCVVFADGTDVYLTENDRVIPDVMVICNRDIIKKNGIYGVPSLVVEILSPGTNKNDRGYKKNLYERCGVKEYWIIDADSRTIEIYLLKDEKFEFYDAYSVFPEYIIEKMTEEEKNNIIYEFKSSLFSDLNIIIEDVFENTL